MYRCLELNLFISLNFGTSFEDCGAFLSSDEVWYTHSKSTITKKNSHTPKFVLKFWKAVADSQPFKSDLRLIIDRAPVV